LVDLMESDSMDKLKISILGTGDMGGAIATALSRRTLHRILVRGSRLGSRSTAKLVSELGVAEGTDKEIAASDVVFVVVPAGAIPQALAPLAGFGGIVVSVSVSATVGQDGLPSSAESIAAALPQAKIVNAFTSIWSTVVRNPGKGEKTSVFVCSDNDHAKAVVCEIAREAGFEPINGGKLAMALYTEALGMFAVRLALDSGYGKTITFRAFKAAP
jgi:8-hydroxy-5-deazaflavin:NADPH oxidoreductase